MSGFGYNVLGFGANASSAAGGASDDEFNRVSFLSHFEGSNNGVNNAFDDGSTSNHTISLTGNVTQGSFGPFARLDGEWGVSFDGSGDILKTPSLTIGTGTITYECWLNFNTVAGNATIVCFNDSDSARVSVYNSDGDLKIYSSANGARTVKSNAFTTPNSWIKLLLVRASNTATVYLDGTSVGTGTMPENLTGVLAIGAYAGSEIFNGIISNVRLSDNARQSGNYTVETAPLTSDSNTDLLTCQSNRFVDNSSNGHTITPSGNPAITAFGPILTSAVYDPAVNGASSIARGGARDNYISAGASSDFHFGSGNFTVEFWTYPLATGKWVLASGNGSIVGTSISWQYGYGTFDFYYGSSYVQITSPTLTLNSWQYITVVRNGATITVYKDGVSTGTANIGSNTLNTGGSEPFYVGGYPAADIGQINGYLSDVRVVKGTAVYTSNFTPPTAPLTAITNTKLLLNMADGQAIDSAAQNELSLAGTAKTSTAQQKFGTASILFDGNSDYAYATVSTPIGAGDYTVECFVYFNTVEYAGVWQFDDVVLGSQAYHGPVIFIGTSSPFKWATMTQHGSNQSIYSTSGPSADQWYHVANVRTNGVVKIFVDGTQIIDDFNDTTDYSARNKLTLGGFYSSDYYLDGYIDEFRVSQFARYTSNFTAPTAAFTDKGQ